MFERQQPFGRPVVAGTSIPQLPEARRQHWPPGSARPPATAGPATDARVAECSVFGCGLGRAEPPAPRIFELRQHSRGDVADLATSPPRRRLGETVPPGSARRRMRRTFQAAPGKAASEFGCGRGRAEPQGPQIFARRQPFGRLDAAGTSTTQLPEARRQHWPLGSARPPATAGPATDARVAECSVFGCGLGRAESQRVPNR